MAANETWMGGAMMMVNSADVKSLLLRLHDEIQVGMGKPGAQHISFAQSLGESLVSGAALPIAKGQAADGTVPAPAKDESTDGIVPATAKEEAVDGGPGSGPATVTPKVETALLPALDTSTNAVVNQDESETSKLAERPSVQETPQIIEPKISVRTDPEAKAVAGKHALKSVAPPVEQKDKTETKREKGHDNLETATNTGVVPSSEPKAAIETTGQVAVLQRVVAEVLPVNQPVPVDTPVEAASEDAPGRPQAVKVSGSSAVRRATAQAVKTVADVQESRKGRGIAASAEKADADREGASTTDIPSPRTSVLDEQAKMLVPAKSGSANDGLHAATGLIAAQVSNAPQTAPVGHAAVQTRDSVPADVMRTAMPDSRTMEPQQATVHDHRVLTATASTLEVGMPSGTHGWLKIRAELTDTGAIKAVVSSTSATGQEMLHRELPSLSSFLEQERVAVSSLVVHQSAPSSGFDAISNSGGGALGQQMQGDGESAGQREQSQGFDGAKKVVVPDGLLDIRSEELLVPGALTGGGWLSVRA